MVLIHRGFCPRDQAMDVEWTCSDNADSKTATFVHWPYRAARWMGDFDRDAEVYRSKNESAVRNERVHSLFVTQPLLASPIF